MAKPIIVSGATCKITFGTTLVDLSEHVRTFTPLHDRNVVENRTLARPAGRDHGSGTYGCTIGFGWSPELYAVLQQYLDTPGTLEYRYRSTDAKAIRGTVIYGSLPWGDFTDGDVADGEVEFLSDAPLTVS